MEAVEGCLLSRPSGTLSSTRSGGEGWGEEAPRWLPPVFFGKRSERPAWSPKTKNLQTPWARRMKAFNGTAPHLRDGLASSFPLTEKPAAHTSGRDERNSIGILTPGLASLPPSRPLSRPVAYGSL